MGWHNGLVEWVEDDVAFLSVAFSWLLPQAYQKAVFYGAEGYRVRVGGPGVWLPELRAYMGGVAEVGGVVDALVRHNRDATMASRGCPVGCYFCIVPKMEGKVFEFLPDFIPRPILCDNNLSGLPVKYQEYIIQKYQWFGVMIKDCNSGFEPKTFDDETYRRWRAVNRGPWRFAYDEESEEEDVFRMTRILKEVAPYNKRVYVLVGNEPFTSCYRRVMQVIEWGCEPFVQPFIPLNAMEKRSKIAYDWDEARLRDLARWSNRFLWRRVRFEDYKKLVVKRGDYVWEIKDGFMGAV